ncbi:MAG: ExbD/TolR family protein [Campylobacterota bacterium]
MKVKKFDQINVIPFIDIMLVLLVIVLTTATFVAKGIIPVDLPQASSSDQKEIKHDDVIITIKDDGVIMIEDKEYTKSEFAQYIGTLDSKKPIIINSDKGSRFEHFVFVLDRLKGDGFQNVGVLSSEE